MEVVILSVISIFAVLGISCFIKELIRHALVKGSTVVLYEYHSENDAEYDLRCIRMKYPDCKICIINRGENSEFLNLLIKSIKNTEIVE